MLDANELKKGTAFILDGEPYQVIEYQHYKPGRGNAIIRTKIRHLRTGSTIPRNFLSNDRFEEALMDRRTVQFLYADGQFYYMMDKETYDQIQVPTEVIGDRAGYLKEGTDLTLVVLDEEPIDLDLSASVRLEVTESELAVAGDTATGANKTIVCETGLQVHVPLFIEVGDVIRVDTRSGEYITRVSK